MKPQTAQIELQHQAKINALYLEGGWEVKESLAMNECLRTATCSDKHIVNPPFRVGGWETEVEKLQSGPNVGPAGVTFVLRV